MAENEHTPARTVLENCRFQLTYRSPGHQNYRSFKNQCHMSNTVIVNFLTPYTNEGTTLECPRFIAFSVALPKITEYSRFVECLHPVHATRGKHTWEYTRQKSVGIAFYAKVFESALYLWSNCNMNYEIPALERMIRRIAVFRGPESWCFFRDYISWLWCTQFTVLKAL